MPQSEIPCFEYYTSFAGPAHFDSIRIVDLIYIFYEDDGYSKTRSIYQSLPNLSIEFQILSKNVKCKAALDVDDDIKISFDVIK